MMMLDPGELSANEHCVLQMLSLLTASGPNSKMSWGQLLIFRDWHWAWNEGNENQESGSIKWEKLFLSPLPWCKCNWCKEKSSLMTRWRC